MEAPPIEVLRLMYQRQTFQVLSAVFNGAMLWDLVICFPAELRYIFLPEIATFCNGKNKGRLAIPSILWVIECHCQDNSLRQLSLSISLLVSRLLVIPMISLVFSVTLGQPSNCMAVYRSLLILYAISNANACAVFIIRTIVSFMQEWIDIDYDWHNVYFTGYS